MGIMAKVAIIIGSQSDLTLTEGIHKYCDFFGLESEIRILSAHRQPKELTEYLSHIEASGVQVIIAAAGMAAHLPGVVAAQTVLPVIGVPLDASPLGGMDALYSIVQMPKGIPVGTMAIGQPGMINAVIFAARIIALQNQSISERLKKFQDQGCKL